MLACINIAAEKLSQRERLLGALLLLMITGIADYLTGPEVSLTIFYLVAIVLMAWCGGALQGAVISVLASATLLIVELSLGREYSSPLILVWNLASNVALFLIVSVLVVFTRRKIVTLLNMALTDPLTGLSNRRYFQEQLERECARVRRYPEAFTLAYIDLDNFKRVNDTLGHSTGDQLLQEVATVLRTNLREADLAARLGGDEFAILFPALQEKPAKLVLEKLRHSLYNAMELHGWPVTFSIGVVTYHEPMASIRDMLKKTDDLMYKVKKEGKDSVVYVSYPSSDLIRPGHWKDAAAALRKTGTTD